MTAYQVAELYKAIRLHFTTEHYDFFRYKGKCSKSEFIPESTFYIFEKLTKKYKEDILDFFVANFLSNPTIWINELLTEESFETYKEYKKTKQSLTYSFIQDIINLTTNYGDLNKIIKVEKNIPILMTLTLRNNIKLESFIILNMICNFFPYWDSKMEDNILWKNLKFKCTKYTGFLNVDLNKMKTILAKQLREV